MNPPTDDPSALRCTGSCLVCDQIEIGVDPAARSGVQPVLRPPIRNACERCRQDITVFLETARDVPPGQQAAIEQAATILRNARLPLVCGLTDQSLETQQAAVAVARACNAAVDWTSGNAPFALQHALQETGAVSCTWQEIRERADLVVFWACDVAASHPKFLPRFVTASQRQVTIDWDRSRQRQALRILRAGHANESIGESSGDEGDPAFLKEVDRLRQQLDEANWPVIIVADSLAGQIGDAGILSLFRFVRAQNDRNHCRLVCLSSHENSAGVESTLTSLAGGPYGITFRHHEPAFRGREFSVEQLIGNRWVDALLLIGSPDQLPGMDPGYEIPRIWICDRVRPEFDAEIVLRSSRWGLGCDGTGLRDDGVPVFRPRQFACQLPLGGDVCRQLVQQIRALGR